MASIREKNLEVAERGQSNPDRPRSMDLAILKVFGTAKNTNGGKQIAASWFCDVLDANITNQRKLAVCRCL